MSKELKYNQLLDLQWVVRKSTIHAQSKYDEMYQTYGKKDRDDLLTELAYDDLKQLREASKTLKQVMDILQKKDLYANGD